MTDLETALAVGPIIHAEFWRVAEAQLPPDIFRPFRLRYGLLGDVWHSRQEIADVLDITKAQVRQRIAKGLRLMRHRERRREYARD